MVRNVDVCVGCVCFVNYRFWGRFFRGVSNGGEVSRRRNEEIRDGDIV